MAAKLKSAVMAALGIGEVSAMEVAVLPDLASFKLKQFVAWS